MNCKNCGNMLQPGVMICPFCNTPVNQPMNQPMQQPMGQPMGQPMNQPMGQAMQPMYGPMNTQPYMAPPKKKHTVLWVILGIIGVIIIAAVIIVLTCKKMTCSLGGGSFTVYYTDSDIIACTTTGNGTCDLDNLKSFAKTYGVSNTLSALKTQNENAGATCTYK